MIRRVVVSVVSAVAISAGLGLVAAPKAAAGCDGTGEVFYTIYDSKLVWKATSLEGSYVEGAQRVTAPRGTAWSVSASIPASLSADAEVVLAKAGEALGVPVVAFSSGETSESVKYTLNIAKGKIQRLQQYKRAYRFGVKKTQLVAQCRTITIDDQQVTAPVQSDDDEFFLYALVN